MSIANEYVVNKKNFHSTKDREPLMSIEEFYNLYVMNNVSDLEIRYVYFDAEIWSIFHTLNVIDKLNEAGETDITKLDVELIQMCVHNDISVEYAKKAVQYFKENATSQHGQDAFDEYVELILNDVHYEIAFWELIDLDGWDDFSDTLIDDQSYCQKLSEYYNIVEENTYTPQFTHDIYDSYDDDTLYD